MIEKYAPLQSPTRIKELIKIFIEATKVDELFNAGLIEYANI
jgi:hypothetical protein